MKRPRWRTEIPPAFCDRIHLAMRLYPAYAAKVNRSPGLASAAPSRSAFGRLLLRPPNHPPSLSLAESLLRETAGTNGRPDRRRQVLGRRMRSTSPTASGWSNPFANVSVRPKSGPPRLHLLFILTSSSSSRKLTNLRFLAQGPILAGLRESE